MDTQTTEPTTTLVEPTPAQATPEAQKPNPEPAEQPKEEQLVFRITDEELVEIVNQSNGNYSRAARAIENKYGIAFTRQAVHKRMAKYFSETASETEELKSWAKDALMEMVTQNKYLKLKLAAAKIILSQRGW